MPLTIAPNGDFKIIKINADAKTSVHLNNLGVIPGAEVSVISKSNGNLIIKIKESRLAINKQLACKIFVA